MALSNGTVIDFSMPEQTRAVSNEYTEDSSPEIDTIDQTVHNGNDDLAEKGDDYANHEDSVDAVTNYLEQLELSDPLEYEKQIRELDEENNKHHSD